MHSPVSHQWMRELIKTGGAEAYPFNLFNLIQFIMDWIR